MTKFVLGLFFILRGLQLQAQEAPSLNSSLTVCPSCPLTSLKQAIQEAPAGTTIYVQGGMYAEGPLLINKPLKLIGTNNPILDGQHQFEPLAVRENSGFVLSGFTIKNCGFSYTEELAGLKLEKTHHCLIENNIFEGNPFSLYIADSQNCIIRNNTITGILRGEADTGNGIHLWNSSHHILEGNTITQHRDGIYIEFVTHSHILNNQVHDNSRYGLHFMSAHENIYENNYFYKNGAGVAIMYSRKVIMKDNHFIQNNGPQAFGLLLKEIHDATIDHNIFANNNIGIYMEGTNRSQFENNKISSNGWGLKFMANCENNYFRHNDFTQNTIDASSNGSQNYDNRFEENYWSDYDGYDLNHDGLGDKPFRLVSLSSVILETTDSSFPLLKSFLFFLLDQIERALPEMIPERLKDDKPAMKSVIKK